MRNRTMDELIDQAVKTSRRKETPEEFEPISEWYCDAILCLLKIPGSKFESDWIAKRLGISRAEASETIARLKKLGLVVRVNRQWKPVPVMPTGTHTTAAIRKYHRQFLAKALESLENDPFHTRSFASAIVAVNPEVFPYARQRIEKFCRELNEELESMATPSEVYKLMIQFFPITPSN
jgi:uncharacterized protein (TIGR02147 family)